MSATTNPAHEGYRRIVLCADDFGMNSAIDAGVLKLAASGRLSATSFLVDGPTGRGSVHALLDAGLQVGLHLNLTEDFGQPGLCMPLGRLIRAAYLRRLPVSEVVATVSRQLDQFHALMGRPPDYVDGHQHVHQLPGVRGPLLETLARLVPLPWLRNTEHPRSVGLPLRLRAKARVIAALGAGSLAREARSRGFVLNPGFLGVYDFQGGQPAYQRWLRCWLTQARAGDVLMCHPAFGEGSGDALSTQRQAEFAVLSGPALGQLLETQRIAITRRELQESDR